ncbi:MAG: cytochrome C [Sulfurimonas sp. RIFCSPHIGHO2_12_FULL_36_9]|jgi:cytochrome c-type protein NapB|uniref:c-type cytochrome n=1 Tax=unclassified Sulfurimonas TaxID=2623549 RepID=UPI0008CE4EFB|nr:MULTISPECIES: cytochrome C [unclassified Sulfurimonas]OHD98503.1 MAG: cytochrome C [Sulfurimonas sp. RIFCSPHIGHO2_12_FULL_36_9]OHD99432.1 MAG: cytochrome C [Sulfurimonas sp. RIFCSPLOWO2_02_FULL_36_28]OHE02672.1 MAG: cytochrome C [Sulfurimonas sp. RIFCSPLOWO2_12_36_12]OHE07506.1 MAG: cytochrome C [Sulfurimonas sp. RIFCSPLOWO2_12_FULL_36_74]
MKKIVMSIVALTATTALMAAVNASACVACHAADWTKVDMGNKNVSAMSKADIAAALKGYKAGTYGAAKKALMVGQVSKYTNEELDAFAQTIGK